MCRDIVLLEYAVKLIPVRCSAWRKGKVAECAKWTLPLTLQCETERKRCALAEDFDNAREDGD